MSNDALRYGQANVNGDAYSLYYSVTEKAGDILTNPTSKAYFQSALTFNPGRIHTGTRYDVYFKGAYQNPTGTVGPTATAFVEFGPLTLAPNIIAQTPALTVGVGTGVEFGFKGWISIVFLDSGPNGSMKVGSDLTFQLTGGATPTQAGIMIPRVIAPINTEAVNVLRLGLISAPSAASYYRLDDINIVAAQRPTNAN